MTGKIQVHKETITEETNMGFGGPMVESRTRITRQLLVEQGSYPLEGGWPAGDMKEALVAYERTMQEKKANVMSKASSEKKAAKTSNYSF